LNQPKAQHRSGSAARLATPIFDRTEAPYHPLAEAGRRLGELLGGKSVAPCTMYRWMHKGVSGIVLEGFRVGGRWVVSDAALTRFVVQVTQAKMGAPKCSVMFDVSNHRRDQQVSRRLDELGI
jgi:hypothetical protein